MLVEWWRLVEVFPERMGFVGFLEGWQEILWLDVAAHSIIRESLQKNNSPI